MAKVIQVDEFYVEVDERPVHATGAGGPHGDVQRVGGLQDAAAKLTDARATIAAVCNYVRAAFQEANRPDELKLTFGIKLGGEVGIPYVTKGTADATIEIEATWKKSNPGPPERRP